MNSDNSYTSIKVTIYNFINIEPYVKPSNEVFLKDLLNWFNPLRGRSKLLSRKNNFPASKSRKKNVSTQECN